MSTGRVLWYGTTCSKCMHFRTVEVCSTTGLLNRDALWEAEKNGDFHRKMCCRPLIVSDWNQPNILFFLLIQTRFCAKLRNAVRIILHFTWNIFIRGSFKTIVRPAQNHRRSTAWIYVTSCTSKILATEHSFVFHLHWYFSAHSKPELLLISC